MWCYVVIDTIDNNSLMLLFSGRDFDLFDGCIHGPVAAWSAICSTCLLIPQLYHPLAFCYSCVPD